MSSAVVNSLPPAVAALIGGEPESALPPVGDGYRRDVLITRQHCAVVRCDLTGELTYQCALARAIGANDGVDFAGLNAQREHGRWPARPVETA